LDKPKKSVRRRTAGVTIDEVAALAGVSPMTVSRVINQGKVRDVTRERVLRAVRELGYTPNLAASSLAAAQHTRIALIYTNPSGAYLRELLVGLLRVASSSAIQLVIDYWDNLDAESERRAARALAGRVDGVILPPPLCESQAAVSELVKAGIPVVAIASGRLSEALSCVRIDDFSAGREMTEHLLRQGHTRIGFIRGRDDLSASALRYDGFVTALREAGLRVPQDVAVTGFDDIPLAASVSPALTTVQQDTKQAGQLLVERLLALIGRQPVQSQSIPVKLVVRESSLRR